MLPAPVPWLWWDAGAYGTLGPGNPGQAAWNERLCKVMTGSSKISRLQERAIAALISCQTILDAAQACKVSEVTVYRWLKLEAFRSAYHAARREVVSQACAQVQAACTEAVQTLRAIMRDPEAPASARVSAAKTILETAVKAVELEDLEQRLAALEAQGGIR